MWPLRKRTQGRNDCKRKRALAAVRPSVLKYGFNKSCPALELAVGVKSERVPQGIVSAGITTDRVYEKFPGLRSSEKRWPKN